MKMRRPNFMNRFLKGEDGATLIEFAISVPILLLFLALIIDGVRLTWAYQATAAGVRDAARMVARIAPNDLCPGENPGPEAAIFEAAEDVFVTDIVVNRLLPDGSPSETVIPLGTIVDDVSLTVSCVIGDYRIDPSTIVEVRAQITIDYLLGNVFGLFGQGLDTVSTEVFDQSKVYGI